MRMAGLSAGDSACLIAGRMGEQTENVSIPTPTMVAPALDNLVAMVRLQIPVGFRTVLAPGQVDLVR